MQHLSKGTSVIDDVKGVQDKHACCYMPGCGSGPLHYNITVADVAEKMDSVGSGTWRDSCVEINSHPGRR